jgi:hypothetical protein
LQDFGGFIVYDFMLLDVVEGGDCKTTFVVGVDGEIDVAEVGKVWVDGIGADFVAGEMVFVGGYEAPS